MPENEKNILFMKRALALAEEAGKGGDIPVGAVIVYKGIIIAEGRNRREKDGNALGHAELEAIANACAALGRWRLEGCDLYVTLEPCPMCAGAIINARISRVFYGGKDEKTGCCGSVINLFELPFYHTPVIKGKVLEKECTGLITRFFENLRKNRKEALRK